jgi:predicted acyltransferase (DUF342 family)/cytoskeletal protein CcmA (bactofilin family)
MGDNSQRLFSFDDIAGLNELADDFARAFSNISTFTAFNALYVDSGLNIGNNNTTFDNSYSLVVAGESFFGDVIVNGSASIAGNISISGEANIDSLKVANGMFIQRTEFESDVSINQTLEVSGNLVVHSGVTFDSTLLVKEDVSMESNLDLSENLMVHGKSFLINDVSMGANLLILGDVSMESNLDISDDLTVHGKSFLIDDVSMGAHLRVLGDVSMESNLDLSENLHVFNETTLEKHVSIKETLLVTGDVSMESNLDLSDNLHVFNTTTLEKHVSINETLLVNGDVSMESNLDVSHDLIVHGKSFLIDDVSMGAHLRVLGDVSMESNLDLSENLRVFNTTTLEKHVSINDTLLVTGDVSMESNLDVSDDLIVHGKSFLIDDVSMGAHLRVLGDVSMESNLDLSENLRVFNTTTLEKHVSIKETLLVTGDVSMESNLDISDNLIVHGKSFLIDDVSMGAHLRVLGDVSMETNLDVSENLHVFNETTMEKHVSIKETLFVTGDVSMESSLDISNNLHVFNETTLDKHVHMGTTLDVSGDVSFHSTLEVETFINTAKIGVNATNPSYSIHIDASDAILLPVGDSDSRPGESNSDVSAVVGLIRYNTQTKQFEGYSNDAWQGLGGVIDVDQNTKITVDTSQNKGQEDHLRFYTAGGERMVIDDSGDIFMKHDLILDGSSNPPKIGVGVDPMISLDISASDAIRVPVGSTDQRPTQSKLGQLRYNDDTKLYETYTTLSTWSGLPLYKTEQPPPLTGISYNSTKEIATIEWNHLVPIYKDVFDGKEYPIYLQTIVDISFTGINDLSSNGWKTIFIGDGNYNTSGIATTPLTKIQFNSNEVKPYSNSTNHDISFDISLDELYTPFPKFGQADSFDIRVYAANRGNGIFNYLEISGVKLLQTQEPSGVEIIHFHDFQKDSFKMDFSFNVDISDTGATMSDVAITNYDISFVLHDTMSLVDQEHSGNQIETWDGTNSLDISHILFNASNFAYPGAKYNIQVRATNSKKVDSSGIGIYGEYGDISTSTGFTNDDSATQYIDTGDLIDVVPNDMTFSLPNSRSIRCHVDGKNTGITNRTILNDVSGEIGITGTSEFFVNYGLQGKNMTDNSGIELVQFEVTKLINGISSDISSLACLSAEPDGPNDASFTMCGFTFESDASYHDQGDGEIYNEGFVYSSNVTCSPGSISGQTFLTNFGPSTDEYELKYEVKSLTDNSYEKLNSNGNINIPISVLSQPFYVDDYSSTPDISFTTEPNLTFTNTTLFGIPSLSTITLDYVFDVSGFANYIIPHSSDNKHSFVGAITNNNVLYTFDPESKKDISMTTTYSFAVTTTKSSEVGGAYVDDTSANLTGSVYYLDHSSGTPTTTTEDFSANIPDKGHLFKDSTTIYDNSYPDIYVFDASNSTIGNEIDTSATDFSGTYANSLSTMLFYFDGKFVSGGYKNSQNIYPFSDWGNNYAIPGPDYGSYDDTSYNEYKWIALDVTSYRTSSTSNTVDLSGLKINNNKPIMSECGVLYEAYISQDGKFGYLGKQYLSNSPPVWFSEEANTTTIGLSKSLVNGALSTNQQTLQIQAIVNYNSSSPIYLIVGLKNDDANPNYFTFS